MLLCGNFLFEDARLNRATTSKQSHDRKGVVDTEVNERTRPESSHFTPRFPGAAIPPLLDSRGSDSESRLRFEALEFDPG